MLYVPNKIFLNSTLYKLLSFIVVIDFTPTILSYIINSMKSIRLILLIHNIFMFFINKWIKILI